jgi:hypothetical protein
MEGSFALCRESSGSAVLEFLRALCAVAEGADVRRAHAQLTAASAAACVSAVLGDPCGRLSIFGGRVGLPRSLGSVLGSAVVRFLGGFRGTESRRIPAPHCDNIAISRDGTTLFMCGGFRGYNHLNTYSVATGALLRTIGGWGDGPLQFKYAGQICIAPDDFVFVLDTLNHRLQILTP